MVAKTLSGGFVDPTVAGFSYNQSINHSGIFKVV